MGTELSPDFSAEGKCLCDVCQENEKTIVARLVEMRENGKLIETGDPDVVNRPSHYTTGKIEVIDFIEDQKLGFHLGNVVKYVARAGKKDPAKEIQDLEKARWYLNRAIEKLSQ
jgi:hypothetical protein